MTLSTGARLGPYEILSPLGEGGMGQVYLARDSRLDRQVALKVLNEGVSTDRVDRFEKEARAASALNHPNIVTIYDAGTSDSISWIAMEHVSGKTLRTALLFEPMPFRKVLALAIQIAEGLAAAHEAGIVHRDLKPENLILTKDDRVKIVDFGLAKLGPSVSALEGLSQGPAETATLPGTVMGTVAYMSPEQARGRPVDHRSDQFSFGSVLYEMATGVRPFRRETAVDTLSAILNQEPPPLAEVNPQLPVPLRWIIERCLAKEPADRYASTQDLAHDLRSVRDRPSDVSTPGFAVAPAPPRRMRSRFALAVALAAAIAAYGGVFMLGRRLATTPVPEFQRLTFRRGGILGARFGPDGRTIAYSAAWDGGPLRLYSTRTDGTESTAFGPPDLDVASISSAGEIALLTRRFGSPSGVFRPGTLARLALAGGAPREMTDGVVAADWSPDGKALAISRASGNGGTRLEFPIGKTLYESNDYINTLRVSPSGDRVAFVETRRTTSATVQIIDRSGKRQTISGGWNRCLGLAWSPDGSEVWFTANDGGWRSPLRAVEPGGAARMVLRLPSWITLEDIAPDGRVLMSLITLRVTMRGAIAGEAERDLSWHAGTRVIGLTPDGKTLLFDEGGEGTFHTIYVRPTDGSPAERIAEGRAMAISADGRWVATNAKERGSAVVLVPTRSGDPKVLDSEGHRFEDAAFLPDGRHLLLLAQDPGHRARTFLRDLDSGTLRPVAAEGLECLVASPDARELACTSGVAGGGAIVTLEGGASRPIPGGLREDDAVLQWSQDGRSLFVAGTGGAPRRVFRLDLSTGQRELWRELDPPDRAGLVDIGPVAITPDGRSYAYSSLNIPSDLYLVKGLR